MADKIGPFVWVAWVLFGLAQLFAVIDGLQFCFPWLPDLLAAIIALFLTWFPFVGSVFAYLGAAYDWKWQWYWALAFAAPQLVFMAIALVLMGLSGVVKRVRRMG